LVDELAHGLVEDGAGLVDVVDELVPVVRLPPPLAANRVAPSTASAPITATIIGTITVAALDLL